MKLSPFAKMLLIGLALASLAGPTRVSKKLVRRELEALARDAGWPEDQVEYAATIALRESGGDPYAVNNSPPREVSAGLWQINTLAWKKWKVEELLDAKRNAEAALEIWKQAGWAPWSTAKERRGKGPGSS